MTIKELLENIKGRFLIIDSDIRQSRKNINVNIESGEPSDQEHWGRKKTIYFTFELVEESQDALFDLIENVENNLMPLVSMKDKVEGTLNWHYRGFDIERTDVGSKIYSAIMNFSVDLIK